MCNPLCYQLTAVCSAAEQRPRSLSLPVLKRPCQSEGSGNGCTQPPKAIPTHTSRRAENPSMQAACGGRTRVCEQIHSFQGLLRVRNHSNQQHTCTGGKHIHTQTYPKQASCTTQAAASASSNRGWVAPAARPGTVISHTLCFRVNQDRPSGLSQAATHPETRTLPVHYSAAYASSGGGRCMPSTAAYAVPATPPAAAAAAAPARVPPAPAATPSQESCGPTSCSSLNRPVPAGRAVGRSQQGGACETTGVRRLKGGVQGCGCNRTGNRTHRRCYAATILLVRPVGSIPCEPCTPAPLLHPTCRHGYAHNDGLADPHHVVHPPMDGCVEKVVGGLLKARGVQHTVLHLGNAKARDAQHLTL